MAFFLFFPLLDVVHMLKEQYAEIFDNCFLAEKIRLGPHLNRQKWSHKLYIFHKDIQLQSSKIPRLPGCWLRRQAIFSLDKEVFMFLNYCYWVCKHTHVPFLPDYSFKICEKPSKVFQKCPRSHCRVRVFNNYADMVSTWLTTTPTSCLHSQRLFQHVSMLSMTISAQRSQWLRQHVSM